MYLENFKDAEKQKEEKGHCPCYINFSHIEICFKCLLSQLLE